MTPSYTQNVFRLDTTTDGAILRLALHLPKRLSEDRKPASQKQRSTLHSFYYENDVLPLGSGWQQASVLLNIRSLSYAVSETLEDGFLAANRMMVAPLIAAYISQSPYLRAVARGWSLGTWHEDNRQGHASWLTLISNPFYEELFNFAMAARDDFLRTANELQLPSEDSQQGR